MNELGQPVEFIRTGNFLYLLNNYLIFKTFFMKKHFLLVGLLALFIGSCNKQVEKSKNPEEQSEQQSKRPEGEYNEMDTAGVRMLTSAAASLDVFPVRGLHNTGYDHSLDGGSKTSW